MCLKRRQPNSWTGDVTGRESSVTENSKSRHNAGLELFSYSSFFFFFLFVQPFLSCFVRPECNTIKRGRIDPLKACVLIPIWDIKDAVCDRQSLKRGMREAVMMQLDEAAVEHCGNLTPTWWDVYFTRAYSEPSVFVCFIVQNSCIILSYLYY